MKRAQTLSKAETVALWQARLQGVQSILLFDYSGLNAAEMTAVRRSAREAGAEVGIVKNTLLRLALKGHALESVGDKLAGTVCVVLAKDDPTAAARFLVKATTDNEKVKLKGGILGSKLLDAADIEPLSKAPGKNELRAQVLGLFAAVPTKFVRLLDAVPGGFARLLAARKASLESSAG